MKKLIPRYLNFKLFILDVRGIEALRFSKCSLGNAVLVSLFVLTLTLSSCATWTVMKNKVYTYSGYGFEAEIPADWMKYNMDNHFIITKDGIVLDFIQIEKRKLDKKLEFTNRKFSHDMLPQEIAEIEIDNLKTAKDILNFNLIENIPYQISDQDGYHIHYVYTTASGLKKEGVQCGFKYDDKWIYRLKYEATSEHYFPLYWSDFKNLVNTFKVL